MNIFKKVKEFIKRNIPIIIIAFITIIIFIFVISYSSSIEPKRPSLIILDEDQRQEVDFEPVLPQESPQDSDEPITQYDVNASRRNERDRVIAANATNPTEVDEYFRTFDIEYTDDGFEPSVASVIENQRVRIKNSTNNSINIVPVIDKFSEFSNGIIIGPNQIFNLRLYKQKLWTVEVSDTYHRLYFMVSSFPY